MAIKYLSGITVDSTVLVVDSANDRVGIGTASPLRTLHINGETVFEGGDANNKLYRFIPRAGNYAQFQILNDAISAETTVWSIYRSGQTVTSFNIENGNVGIGTTSPSGKLHVVDAAGQFTTYDANGYSRFTAVDGSAQLGLFRSGSTAGGVYIGANSNSFQIYTGDFSSTLLTILQASGNVGIGTTSPTGTYGKLTVAGGVHITNDNNAKLEIGRYSAGAPNSYIKLGANSNSLRITNNVDGADIFVIENGGNVGIGTTSPASILHLYKTSFPVLTIGSGVVTGNMGIDTANNFMSIGTETNHGLSFATNNTAQMRLTPAGNLGIGTTSPSAKLQVSGGDGIINTAFIGEVPLYGANFAQLSHTGRSGADKYSFLSGNAGDTYVNSANGESIFFRHNNGSNVIITSTGNVGIGTTAPTAKLQVVGSLGLNGADSNYPFFVTDTSTATNRYNLANKGMGFNLADDYAQLQIFGGNGAYIDFVNAVEDFSARIIYFGGSSFQFQYGTTLTINPTGVGIGTTSPGYKLDVSGAGRFSNGHSGTLVVKHNYSFQQPNWGIKLDGDSGTSGGYLSQYVNIGGFELAQGATYYGGGPYRTDANSTSFAAVAGYGGILTFSTDSGLTANSNFYPSERMRITAAGSVFINSTSMDGKLGINTATSVAYNPNSYNGVNASIRLTNGSAGVNRYTGIAFGGGGSTEAFIGSVQNASELAEIVFQTFNGSAYGERARITSAGNVGIGTTAPSAKLDVRGQTYINNGTSNALFIDTTVADNNTRDAIYLFEDDSAASGRQAISWYNGNQLYYKARLWTEVGGGYASTTFGIDVADNSRTVATRLVINNGNVGIGTTAPGNLLHVAGQPRFDSVGSAPADISAPVTQNKYYGTNSVVLTSPNTWLKVSINGTDYVIPAYSI